MVATVDAAVVVGTTVVVGAAVVFVGLRLVVVLAGLMVLWESSPSNKNTLDFTVVLTGLPLVTTIGLTVLVNASPALPAALGLGLSVDVVALVVVAATRVAICLVEIAAGLTVLVEASAARRALFALDVMAALVVVVAAAAFLMTGGLVEIAAGFVEIAAGLVV